MLAILVLLTVTQAGGNQAEEARFPPMSYSNAFQVYEGAVSSIIGGQQIYTYRPMYMEADPQVVPSPSIQRAVEKSADALAAIAKGLHEVYIQPRISLGSYPEPFAKDQQLLGKLMLAAGDVEAQKGSTSGAYAKYSDLLRYSTQLANSGEGTTPLVGINLSEHARGALWRLSDRMTFDQLADTAALLRQTSTGQRPYTALLAKDERMTLYKLDDLFKRANVMFSAYEKLGLDPFHTPPDLAPEQIRPLKRLQVRDDCIQFFDGWIERTSKPFASRGKQPSYEDISNRTDALLAYMSHHGYMVPACNDLFWYVFLRNQAANGLAAGAFAAKAFLKREARLPTTLSELSPGLLTSLPSDPFDPPNVIGVSFSLNCVRFTCASPSGGNSGTGRSAIPGPSPDPAGDLAKSVPLYWEVLAKPRG